MSDSANQEPSAGAPQKNVALGSVPFYLWPNLLSLDAVAVAVVWLWGFSICEQVPILRPIYYVLALVVWSVYTADRLFDARRLKDLARSTPRHRFARSFFLPLLVLCVAALALATYLVLNRVSFALVPRGLLIAAMVVIYFLFRIASRREPSAVPARTPQGGSLVWALPIVLLCIAVLAGVAWFIFKAPLGRVSIKGFVSLGLIAFLAVSILVAVAGQAGLQLTLPKEIFCGIIFALGVSFPVFELPNNFVSGVLSPESILFMLLCILNCIAISVWEAEEDNANDGGKAIVDTWPGIEKGYLRFAFLLAVLAAWLGGRGHSPILLSIALSAALIGAIGLAAAALSKNLRRALVDLVLLSPLVVIPLFR